MNEIVTNLCLAHSCQIERRNALVRKEERLKRMELYCEELYKSVEEQRKLLPVKEEYVKLYNQRISDAFKVVYDTKQYIESRSSFMQSLESDLARVNKSIRDTQYEQLQKLYSFFRIRMIDHTMGSILGMLLSTNLETFISCTIFDESDCQRISALFGYLVQILSRISSIVSIPLLSSTICINCQCSTSTIEHVQSGRIYKLYLVSSDPEHVAEFMSSVKILSQSVLELGQSLHVTKHMQEYAFIPNLLFILDEYRI